MGMCTTLSLSPKLLPGATFGRFSALSMTMQVYYTTPVNKTEVKGFWCHPCHQDHRGERIELDGTNVGPAYLIKHVPHPQLGLVSNFSCNCKM